MIRNEPIIGAEEYAAVKDVLSSGVLSGYRANKDWHLGGRYVQALEYAFCDFFNVKHAVAMNSATSCLHAACIAAQVKHGVTSTLTFSASAACVLQAGGTVEFTDIAPDTYCMVLSFPFIDVAIPVHLHGHPADMDSIHGRFIIEDASQAIMARYKGKWVGTIGDCGVFSFNQWKQMTCGEGGMLITNNDRIAEVCRLVRNHGETQQDEILGYNYRLTEIQAAIALEQFKKLPQQISYRVELADYLTDKLKDTEVQPPYVQEGCVHSYYTYPIRTKDREELQSALLEAGYYFGQGGQRPLHKYPFYKIEGNFPVAENYERDVMFTDIIRPPLRFADIDKIVGVIERCLENSGRAIPLIKKPLPKMTMSRM